ncbi:pyrimidine 5'-nucleotidase [Zooshikella harenae]|uniref:Pyrimidine 5'-nucleotidase n=1 Tax=Zooshikella harenae TaxID=2827238 RepID=A0ABS5ZAK6_9GAMM|nr:pyrimidine 5'-nucleotidase [Zooshikella harenae]MBU2711010.1 pyrimidine 5'-nucleotidase [Zooshikella harenae]
MKHYEWILFDADETLFHFDAFGGLQRMFAQFNVEFSTDDYQAYQDVNKPLWVDYQNGDITAQQLQHQRFATWSDKLKVSAKDLNSAFLSAMADICKPLEGANSLVSALYGKVKLGIITNGFSELQQIRLERLGLREYFDILVISEQVGFAKPHQAIFEHALSVMGQPERNKVLMVGDNPDTDILGGINAGFETCWLNVNENPTPEAIMPGYQVSSLTELEQRLFSDQGLTVSM